MPELMTIEIAQLHRADVQPPQAAPSRYDPIRQGAKIILGIPQPGRSQHMASIQLQKPKAKSQKSNAEQVGISHTTDNSIADK